MQSVANSSSKPAKPRAKAKRPSRTPPPSVRPSKAIAIAVCRFCKRELLFDALLRRFVGLRGSVEGRPCQHLVAAGVEETITTHVRGREMVRESKLVWFAGKPREVSSYTQSVAAFLAARLQSRLMHRRGLELGTEVQAIREVLPSVQLGTGEVECAVNVAATVIFSRDREAILDRFEQMFPGELDDFEQEEE